jgi:beta-glucosidase
MASFPTGFIWGAATAAHQVEGNNVNSDLWVLEHCSPTLFEEPSLDACDHYQRFAEDIRLLASLGLNCYRFSLEWARIEPERGHFSNAALDHYRRVLAACHENSVTPMVTFYHFSSPRWFAGLGGWEKPVAAELFARYCEHASRRLGDLISFASTFNEPNLPMLLHWISHIEIPVITVMRMTRQAARAIGSRQFGCFFLGDAGVLEEHMIAAHERARCALKAGPGAYPVGVNIALQDEQAAGPKSRRDQKCAEVYEPWLSAAGRSDFLGAQIYTRCRVGKKGDVGPEPGVELTQMGYEIWPDAIEACLRYAAARVSVPIYITESGIATEDDTLRVDFIRRSLEGVLRALAAGVDVRSYIHWTLMDNFEWIMGYRPKFGLVAVDRATQERQVKPSAHYLGEIARQNCLPDHAAIH